MKEILFRRIKLNHPLAHVEFQERLAFLFKVLDMMVECELLKLHMALKV